MADEDLPQIDRPEPQLSEPVVEPRQPVTADRAEPQLSEPVVEPRQAAPPSQTQNIIAELRNSMAVVAKSGAPRDVTIAVHGRHRLTRLMIVVFVVFGYLLLIAGVAIFAATAPDLLEGKGDALRAGSIGAVIRSLDGVAVMRALTGLAVCWIGLFTVVSSRGASARIDGADYARQALVLQKAIAEGVIDIDTR